MEEKFRKVFNQLMEENENELKLFRENDEKYNEIYQSKIIKPLIKLLYNETYSYLPLAGILREVFKGIEYRKFNSYSSTNLIMGTINQHYEFKMANVLAINRKYRESHFTSGRINRFDDYIVFNGLLMEIELPKEFKHYLYLKGKRSILSKDFNEIIREIKLNKYKMEKEEIKEFNIYTSNKEFAEAIVSMDVITKLLEYSSLETEEFCELVFKENHIYLMLPNVEVLGTNIILYEDRETIYQELWKEYRKFSFSFELSNFIINKLISLGVIQ